VRWPAPSVDRPHEGPPSPEFLRSEVHNRVPQYRYQREHWLIPRVGDGHDELPALLIWWVLLFWLVATREVRAGDVARSARPG
jgi:hypothetical protein